MMKFVRFFMILCGLLPVMGHADTVHYPYQGVIEAVDIDEGHLILTQQQRQLANQLTVLDRQGYAIDRAYLARGQLIQYQLADDQSVNLIQIISVLPRHQRME